VVESRPHSLLSLRGRGWPLGEVAIVIRLRPVGADTEVVIEEDVVAGPGHFVPKPLRAAALRWRNVETLRRLAYIAERRTAADVTVPSATQQRS
jgi:hypothetical protein